MSSGSLYKKYGVTVDDPAEGLMAGQTAVGNSLQKALGGIEGLLKKQEAKYVEENTLNMQEYLKSNIKSAGLGADPTDQTAIKKKFGNLINMEEINKTVTAEGKLLKEVAVDDASVLASKSLSENNDPIKAREVFSQSIRNAGGEESLVNAATQAWSDSNAVKFKDMETMKIRATATRTNSLFDAVAAGQDGPQTVELLIADLPQAEQGPARRELQKQLQFESELTQIQKENRAHYIKLDAIQGQRDIAVYQNELASLESKHIALQETGIRDSSYKLGNKYNEQLGGSLTGAIKDRVTNWMEGFSSKNDGVVIKQIYSDFIRDGVKAEDADAALAQAFNEEYQGDSFWGNDITKKQMSRIKTRATDLALNAKNKTSLLGSISDARLAISDEELRIQTRAANLSKKLTAAGRKTKLRVAGAPNIDDAYTTFMQNIAGKPEQLEVGSAKVPPPTGSGSEFNELLDEVTAEKTKTTFMKSMNQHSASPEVTSGPLPEATTKHGDNGLLNWLDARKDKQAKSLKNTYTETAAKKAEELKDLSKGKQKEYIAKLKKAGESDAYINTLQQKLSEAKNTADKNQLSNEENENINKEMDANLTKISPKDFEGRLKGLPDNLKGEFKKLKTQDAKSFANRIKESTPEKEWPNILMEIFSENPVLAKAMAESMGMKIDG
ncbi:MAG: hypothetical protein KAI17_09105 [Thiotrichaceae bacterium]|nr:hypothetical protein [Thiotrichaceae bacterium]